MRDAHKLAGAIAATVAAGAAATMAGRAAAPDPAGGAASSSGAEPQSRASTEAASAALLDAPAAADQEVPLSFLVGWGTLCTLSLGAGGVVGFRSFEGSVAHEVRSSGSPKPAHT